MTHRLHAPILLALSMFVSGCIPMSDPSMGYSGQEMSAMTGLPTAIMRNDDQCKRSAAILSNPTSTPNERYGATTAARANA